MKALIKEVTQDLRVRTEREWRIFCEVNHVQVLPLRLQNLVQHAFVCGFCAGGLAVTGMYEQRGRKNLRVGEN